MVAPTVETDTWATTAGAGDSGGAAGGASGLAGCTAATAAMDGDEGCAGAILATAETGRPDIAGRFAKLGDIASADAVATIDSGVAAW